MQTRSIDECHHVSAVSFERILKIVNAKFVYGLTATPTRQDGQQPIIFMQCGAIRYQVGANEQAAKSAFERFVVPRFTSFKKSIRVDDSEFGIAQIYSAIATNAQRNKLITTDVLNSFRKGRTPIVLTQRADHVGLLADALEKLITNVIRLTGGASAKEKRAVMERLHAIPQGEQNVDRTFIPNQNRSLMTSLVEWLEQGDYFQFIKNPKIEMESCVSEMAKCFSEVKVLEVDTRANW